MTRKEFGIFVSALKTYFSREKELLPTKETAELWYRQLQDIPYKVAEAALNKWVATNKWSPSIADIRAMAVTITTGEKPLWSDGWEQVQRAIKKYGMYAIPEAMDSFTDEVTKKTVERLGFRELCMSENPMQDRANFRMIFEQLADRQEKEQQLPFTLTSLIEEIRRESIESNVKRIGTENAEKNEIL